MKLLLTILFLFQWFVRNQSLKCDFETSCYDFVTDDYWGKTDGYHPEPLDYDHTYGNKSGHYIFLTDIGYYSQITSKIDVSLNETRCLEFAYYSENVPLYIMIDDQTTIATFQYPVTNWTSVSILLPNLRYDLMIRVNGSRNPVLLLDDLYVGPCSKPQPTPPVQTIYFCDFENADLCQLESLSYYSYYWYLTNASDANKSYKNAPSTDYTTGTSSGHYFISHINYEPGGVGYFSTKTFTFSTNQTYCLHFEFYRFSEYLPDFGDDTTLQVFALTKSNGSQIHILFETTDDSANYKWKFRLFPVPVGEYSILFGITHSQPPVDGIAIDNIGLTTCPYTSPTLNYTIAPFIKYNCDFERDQCQMFIPTNENLSFYNFTRINANMLEDKTLGPLVDHTTNTANGYFLYWNYTLPFRPNAIGKITTPRIHTDVRMCLQFSYYLKSADNITSVELYINNARSSRPFWDKNLNDTNGWQTVTINLPSETNTDTITFNIEHDKPVSISFALDDIIFDRCWSFDHSSTTTTTTSIVPITSTTRISSHSTSSLTETSTNPITTSKDIHTTSYNNRSIKNKTNHYLFIICLSFIIFYFL